jgi:hypothetical protein
VVALSFAGAGMGAVAGVGSGAGAGDWAEAVTKKFNRKTTKNTAEILP